MKPLLKSFRLYLCFSLLFSLTGAIVYEKTTYAANLGETSARISCTPTAAESIKRLKGFQKIEWSVRHMIGDVLGPEKIVIFSDNKPSNEFIAADYDFDKSSGDLLVTFAPLTIDDNALFSCSITLEQGEDSKDTKLIVYSAPPETQRKPEVVKVSDPRDYAEFTFLENQLESQITEVAMCRSGYAAPQAEISWLIEDKDGNRVRTIDIDADIYEDLIIDNDNSRGKHGAKEVNLPLNLHLSSKYHLHRFKCIVTYKLAGENHEEVTKSYERQFPAQDVIKVIHPVSSVYLVKDGKELGDVVDISDPTELDIQCQSNGFDPEQEVKIKMVPSLQDLRKEVVKCSSSRMHVCKVVVTCSARNLLNDKEVIQSFPLSFTRFPDFECKTIPNDLLRLTDPVQVSCIPENSSDKLLVKWYPSPSEKLSGGGLVKKLEKSKNDFKASSSGNVFLPPNVPYVALVAVVSQDGDVLKKAEFFTPVKETIRETRTATIEDGERGVGGKWIAVDNPFSEERVGANSISFWKFHQTSHQFTRLDNSSEEKLTNGVNRLGVDPATASRFVKEPLGGDYTACYDIYNDADSIIMNRSFRTFEAAANVIHSTLNSPGEYKQCRFYSVKEKEGFWWLWIIIIVILLICVAIGAIFLRIRSDNKEEEDLYSKIDEPIEGPSVIAVQSETAADTRAEFTYKVHIQPITEQQDTSQIPAGPSTHPPITCSSESEIDESEEENNSSANFNEQAPILR